MEEYIVAFKGTGTVAGMKGIITWGVYANKEAFEREYTPLQRKDQEVLEAGITRERAMRLTLSTPMECRMAYALARAQVGLELDLTLLGMGMDNALQLPNPDSSTEISDFLGQ